MLVDKYLFVQGLPLLDCKSKLLQKHCERIEANIEISDAFYVCKL